MALKNGGLSSLGGRFPCSIEGFHGATVLEGLQDFGKAFDLQILQELIGQGMDPPFLGSFFGRGTVKLVEKPGKTYHMNELMGDDISHEGKQLDVRVTLHSLPDHVILDTDLEKFPSFASPQPLVGRLGIAMDLREGGVDDFLLQQVLQRLNIVAVALPFRCGKFVKIADELFRNRDGLPQDLDLFPAERNPFHFLGYFAHGTSYFFILAL